MCRATQEALSRERLADDNESRFIRAMKTHRAIPLKEPAVQMNIAQKCHPNKQSKKNFDGLSEVLAPGSVVLKTDQHTWVIRKPGKLDFNIAKFVTRNEFRKGSRNTEGDHVQLQKTTEVKIPSHTKEFKRIRKGDRKMRHGNRETVSGISLNRSNTARTRRVGMPKIPSNFAPPKTITKTAASSEPQITAPQSSEILIAPPPMSSSAEFLLPSTSAPMEAIQQVLPRSTKRGTKKPKIFWFRKR